MIEGLEIGELLGRGGASGRTDPASVQDGWDCMGHSVSKAQLN